MKNLRLLTLLLFSATTFLSALRVGNFKDDGSFDTTTTQETNKISSTAKLVVSAFDKSRNVLYLADPSLTPIAKHALMRVDFRTGAPVITAIGDVVDSAAPNPVSILTTAPANANNIQKLDITEDGDLIVMLKPTAAAHLFYVIKNPHGDLGTTPVIYASPTINDGAAAASSPVALSYAGKSGELSRIVVAIAEATQTDLATGATNSRLTTFLFNRAAGTFTQVPATLHGSANPINLNGNSGTADSIGTLITESATSRQIYTIPSMHWNKDLERLYIGTSRDDATALGKDHQFIVCGYFDNANALKISGFVGAVGTTTASSALGMNTNLYWAVKKIQSFKSQGSGKNYLVTHIDYNNHQTTRNKDQSKCIYAFPLVENVGNTIVTDNDKGTAADVTVADAALHSVKATDHAKLYSSRTANVLPANVSQDIRALVGGAPVPGGFARTVAKIEVVRDTVFVLLTPSSEPGAGPNNSDLYAGIWASSPIYNTNGHIKAWTAWKRVVSSCVNPNGIYNVGNPVANVTPNANHVIHDFKINEKTGEFYLTLGESRSNANQAESAFASVTGVAIEKWGSSGDLSKNPFSPLKISELINTQFGENGVWTVAHFPAIRTAGLGLTGLTIVGQKNKVALLSTGGLIEVNGSLNLALNAAGNNTVDNVANNYVDASNVANNGTNLVKELRPYGSIGLAGAEFDSSAAGNLSKRMLAFDDAKVGDVLCATVTKCHGLANPFPTAHGFIFVGGSNGLAVLSNANGNGFNSRYDQGLQDLSTNLNGFSWKKIPGIEGSVHELVTTENFLYALVYNDSISSVYRIRLPGNANATLMDNVPPAGATDAPIMFVDNMVTANAANTVNLSAVGSIIVGVTNANGTRYLNNVVVIQKVLEAKSNEYFVNMIVAGDRGPSVLVASVNSSGSSVRAIIDGDAAQINDFDDTFVFKFDVPYHIRRMHLVTPNLLNMSGTMGTSLDNGALSGAAGNAYGDATSKQFPSNLYVLSTDFSSQKSKIYCYAVSSTIDNNLRTDFSGVNIIPAKVRIENNTNWIATNNSNPTAVTGFNGVDLNFLANGFNLEGIPYVYASSSYSFNDHLNHLSADNLSPVKHDAGTGVSQGVFGMVTLESGAKVIYGTFGIRFID